MAAGSRLPLGFAMLAVGAVIIDKGVPLVQSVFAGGGGSSGVSDDSGVAPSSGSASGGIGQVTEQMLQAGAAKFGWDSSEISDWKSVIGIESGGNPAAVNSSSGAKGVGQFLGSTLTEYAADGATSPDAGPQTNAMAQYIHDRYGTPSKALAHEHQYGWY